MREAVTKERIDLLMKELARSAPRRGAHQIYFVGGGTAVYLGWRPSSIDVDLYSDKDAVFRDIQSVKERLNVNIEFARPEDFVPPLRGTDGRHVFIDTVGSVTYFHYDPYAQVFSKIVRGFRRDLADAHSFIRSKLVDPDKLRSLVAAIPESKYAKYPNLSSAGVQAAIEQFLDSLEA